jgi:Ni/Co efflux regulator RcnB
VGSGQLVVSLPAWGDDVAVFSDFPVPCLFQESKPILITPLHLLSACLPNVRRALAVSLSVACLAFPAAAEKPERLDKPGKSHQQGSGNERGGGQARAKAPSSPQVNIQVGAFFGEPQRTAVRNYYEPQFRAGKCPPGLAKKGNGCQPPGQARKQWRLGQPLPGSVVFHPVPQSVTLQIGLPPAGHRYVRVAADILLIAIGTGLVIDAIEDLSRL